MSDILFGRGAQGILIAQLQAGLVAHGHPLARIDGDYGGKTEAAVRAFQTATGTTAPTGAVTHTEWTALTGTPPPSLFDRCLQLTASFEGHQYTVAKGNFDGALLTWGIIGFTLLHGEVQKIVLGIDSTAPHLVTLAFGTDTPELLHVMRLPRGGAEQIKWANAQTRPGGGLAEPWRSGFARFGEISEVQALQNARAKLNYFDPAVAAAAGLVLTSERGISLCFDIHVQNGGIKKIVRDRLMPLVPAANERAFLERLANEVADTAKNVEFREDVRHRKLTIASGSGTVHGKAYTLANWGLSLATAAVT